MGIPRCRNEEATGSGLWYKKKQAQILTEEDEELFWTKGLLGNSTSQSLLDMLIFYNGLFPSLRSRKEHRQLAVSNRGCRAAKWKALEPSRESKGKKDDTKGSNPPPANLSNPQRRFVRLFKLYWELCPPDAPGDAFYLQPSHKPTPLGNTNFCLLLVIFAN